jgi:membrane protease YdiL (CAAX protease family)
VTVLGTIAATTAAGIVFALLRLRSGSLLAPVLAHVATNSFAYLGAAGAS